MHHIGYSMVSGAITRGGPGINGAVGVLVLETGPAAEIIANAETCAGGSVAVVVVVRVPLLQMEDVLCDQILSSQLCPIIHDGTRRQGPAG